jgi:hypothetical protein
MNVIFHQHSGIAACLSFLNDSAQANKKIGPIHAVFKDRFALYSSDDDMMQGSWSIDADFAWHGIFIS